MTAVWAPEVAFPVRLREAMGKRGVGVPACARAVGVTTTAVYTWLRGKSAPRQGNLEDLARFLGVDADWLWPAAIEPEEPDAAAEPVPPIATFSPERAELEREVAMLRAEIRAVVSEELRLRKDLALAEAKLSNHVKAGC